MNSRFDFLGVQFSVINQDEGINRILELKNCEGYICFPDASVVSIAQNDQFLVSILNNSLITFPDGKPSEIVAKLQGYTNVSTVSGFNLCKSLLDTNCTHFFYGADDETLNDLLKQLKLEFPNSSILGVKSPPFVSLNEIENNSQILSDIQTIALIQPDFVWLGISSPKQDYLMHYFNKYLPNSLMIGVGGVFLYLANPEMKSPEWIKKIGLRWLYRLIKEPGRLGPKYKSTFLFLLHNSSYFISLLRNRLRNI